MRLKHHLAIALSLVLAAILCAPAPSLAETTTVWELATFETSLDVSTLSASTDAAFPGDEVELSVGCSSACVTSVELAYENTSPAPNVSDNQPLSLSVLLVDPDGDGVFEGTLPVTDTMAAGTWEVTELRLLDGSVELGHLVRGAAGRGIEREYADLTAATFTVGSTKADTTPPLIELDSISIAPRTADVGDRVTIRVSAADDYGMSAHGFVTARFYNRGYVTLLDPEGDGIFEGGITVDATTRAGTWQLYGIEATDDAGNTCQITSSSYSDEPTDPDLSAHSFVVTKNNDIAAGEQNPPVIELIGAVTSSNPAVPGTSVRLQVRVTDDCGVDEVYAYTLLENRPYIMLDFANRGDGLWEAIIPVDGSTAEGQWGVHSITAADVHGNEATTCTADSFSAYMMGSTIADLSMFDFSVRRPKVHELPHASIDLESVEVTPNPVQAGATLAVSVRAQGDRPLTGGSVQFATADGYNWKRVELAPSADDNGLLTGTLVIPGSTSAQAIHAVSVMVNTENGGWSGFAMPGTSLATASGFTATDLSAFDFSVEGLAPVSHTRPIASTFSVSPKEADVGDVLTFTVEVEGTIPAREVMVGITHDTMARCFDNIYLEKAEGNTYVGTYEVTEDMARGGWHPYGICVTNTSGTHYWVRDTLDATHGYDEHVRLSGGDFVITRTDFTAPVLVPERCRLITTNPDTESSTLFSLGVEDEHSGVATSTCKAVFLSPDGTEWHTYTYPLDLGEEGVVYFNCPHSEAGEWRVLYLQLVDLSNNTTYVYNSNVTTHMHHYPYTTADLSMYDMTVAEVGERSLDDAEVTAADVVFNGRRQTPQVTVKLGDETLVEGRDFEALWYDNVNAGTGRVMVCGIGEYTGSADGFFDIAPADLSTAMVGLFSEQEYVPGGPEPDVVVTLGGRELVAGVDYEARYSKNQTAGTARVAVVGMGNYTGIAEAPFEVTPLDISGGVATIAGGASDGDPTEPAVTVVVDGKELMEKRDFTVAFESGVVAGVAKAIITGVRGCTGTIVREFAIEEAEAIPMFRLYNRWTYEHFYTGDAAERDKLVSVGWTDEGIGWYAPAAGDPVYRLYNQYAPGGDHHYTMDVAERDMLVAAGWSDEGIGWYSDPFQRVPVYREYNPWEFAHNHNYTADLGEHEHLVSVGWKDEGIGWYGVQPASRQ